MNKSFKIIFFNIFIVDLFVVIGLFFYDIKYLINSQVAFLTSLFIYIATFLSYKKNVLQNIQNYTTNQPDEIEKIEDPYGLYDEQDLKLDSKEDFEKFKNSIKQNNFKNLKKTIFSFFSILRLISYAIFIFAFFVLLRNQILDIFSYIAGLFIAPFGMLISKKALN